MVVGLVTYIKAFLLGFLKQFVWKKDIVYEMYDSVDTLVIAGDDLCVVVNMHDSLCDITK